MAAAMPASAQQVTLNFLTAEPPEVYEAAIAAFEAKNPDIKVAYERVPFDSMNAQVEARLERPGSEHRRLCRRLTRASRPWPRAATCSMPNPGALPSMR